MSHLNVAIHENRKTFKPGDEIAGQVSWAFDQAPKALELRLFWFTRGKGTQDAETIDTARFETPSKNDTRSFRFRLPDAPYSFSGKLISLIWALELVSEPSKESERVEFLIAPGEREIQA